MSSFVDLQLPPDGSDGKLAVSSGWEQAHIDGNWNDSPSAKSSICRHAVASGYNVHGTSDDTNQWTTWNTSFSPHRVLRVASNHDGSIIAASTDGGIVSLLRGSDGNVLATQKVTSLEGIQRPAEVSFVGAAHFHHSSDVLVIVTPVSDDFEETESLPNALILSGIDGERLNDENSAAVSEAVRTLSLNRLSLGCVQEVKALQGCFINQCTVRFIAVDFNGNIATYDYNTQEKKVEIIQKEVLANQLELGYYFSTSVGIRIQNLGDDCPFFVLTLASQSEALVCWYDIYHANISCQYTVTGDESFDSDSRRSSIKVVTMDPVRSCSEADALSIAIAWKTRSSSEGTHVQVVQVVAENTMGLVLLSHPHTVFNALIHNEKEQALDMALAGSSLYPYRFRTKTLVSSTDALYKEFVPATGSGNAGSYRLLLAKQMFDDAEKMLAQSKGEHWVEAEQYAQVHPSEISLQRIQQLLSSGPEVLSSRVTSVLDSFISIGASASSGDEASLRYLTSTLKVVSEWPGNTETSPPIDLIRSIVSPLSEKIEEVLNGLIPPQKLLLEREKINLESRLEALTCLESLVGEGDGLEACHGLSNVRSIGEIFKALISKRLFSSAEFLVRSKWGSKLSAESVVLPMLTISPAVDPKSYSLLLKETALPVLSVNHQILPYVRNWACQTADMFDVDNSNGLGLDSSIFLLQTVLEATKSLNARHHTSFSSFSPFADTETTSTITLAPSPTTSSSAKKNASFTADDSCSNLHRRPQKRLSDFTNPTLLTLKELPKRKYLPSLINEYKLNKFEKVLEGGEDCVDIKLMHAYRLKEARDAGLSNNEMNLRNYSELGGAQYLAKKLLQKFSNSAACHNDRTCLLSRTVKPFCERARVSFDEMLLQHCKVICSDKSTTRAAIEECASVARCCVSASTKCEIALITFRASRLCNEVVPCLKELADSAMKWAPPGSSIVPELEEGIRLCTIDGIVLRYCGSGARRSFRVDDDRHASKLLDFVCLHVKCSTVLEDVLDLCEAFHHIIPSDACSLILQRAILAKKTELCVDHVARMLEKDQNLAIESCSKTISFCLATMRDNSQALGKYAGSMIIQRKEIESKTVCSAATSMLSALQAHNKSFFNQTVRSSCLQEKKMSWGALHEELTRLQELMNRHGLFIPRLSLQSETKQLEAASELLSPVLQCCLDGSADKLRRALADARRGSSIVFGLNELEVSASWCHAVKDLTIQIISKSDDEIVVELLELSGMLDSIKTNDASSDVLLSVSLGLCAKAARKYKSASKKELLQCMQSVVRASSFLQDYMVLNCPRATLPTAVSLAALTDTITQILIRVDEGIGERIDTFRIQLNEDARFRREPGTLQMKSPRATAGTALALHGSWYVGDGLLLPPFEAFSEGISVCKEAMSFLQVKSVNQLDSPTLELHKFLESNGVHAMGLRMLCISSAVRLSSSKLYLHTSVTEQYQFAYQESIRSLTERSLGGSGNGITSGIVDSQLAVSFMVLLPIKLAYRVYRAALPTGIARRDFSRVMILSNIGAYAAQDVVGLPKEWKKQTMFVSQCIGLSFNARWWKLLKSYGIDFDPQKFDKLGVSGGGSVSSKATQKMSNYVASLLPSLIQEASKSLNMDGTRVLATTFAESYDLDPNLAIQKHVEYVLSFPWEDDDSRASFDPVLGDALQDAESAARDLLARLPSSAHRSKALRRCVNDLEKNAIHDTNYEAHSLVLRLYHQELSLVIRDTSLNSERGLALKTELNFIHRRLDVIEILLSFFQGGRARPAFPSFFSPLAGKIESASKGHGSVKCGILGGLTQGGKEVFDPIGSLNRCLSENAGSSITKALDPLCVPLGIPRGYIHARALILRFFRSRDEQVSPPSVNDDLLPVVDRISANRDKTELLLWCAGFYRGRLEERSKCLEQALHWAIKASSEIERRRRAGLHTNDENFDKEEEGALDTVKKISKQRAMISDQLAVRLVLREHDDEILNHFPFYSKLRKSLFDGMEDLYNDGSSPENVIEYILSESSTQIANATLDDQVSLPVRHIRAMSNIIKRGCIALADEHSHVNIGLIAKRLARRWLIHGDGASEDKVSEDSHDTEESSPKRQSGPLFLFEEDETVNFVMDLSSLGSEDQGWSDDVGSGRAKQQQSVTVQEEQSVLKFNGSLRETSEFGCRRVALRIAFVLSFVETPIAAKESREKPVDENKKVDFNAEKEQDSAKKSIQKSKKVRLASIFTESQESISAIEHAQELLGIVFAKSSGSPRIFDASQSVASYDGSAREQRTASITFSMRHRALRAAATLCPQSALERVVSEEGYFSSDIRSHSECSLKHCSFGAFLAKEIEEMGLPLPHSNLVALSTMHFPSYARALMRHHGASECNGQKGRLLLLLLEMCLKEEQDADVSLINDILIQMVEIKVPRSLLIGCESLLSYVKHRSDHSSASFIEGSKDATSQALQFVATMILKELRSQITHSEGPSLSSIETVGRLGHVVGELGDNEAVYMFIDTVLETLKLVPNTPVTPSLLDVAHSSIRWIKDCEQRNLFLAKLMESTEGGK